MVDIVLILTGACFGIIIGMAIIFWLMGKDIRDQFMGRNQEDKPIVIDWIDGRDQDVCIKMRKMVIFRGKIQEITMSGGFRPGPMRVHIELMSKSELIREFRT
jgi:hypothetical protein